MSDDCPTTKSPKPEPEAAFDKVCDDLMSGAIRGKRLEHLDNKVQRAKQDQAISKGWPR